MANPTEIPQLVGEFVEMSKAYLLQETVEPAKRLGRLAGFSAAAALCWSLAAVFATIAVNRWIIEALPEGTSWSALGYVLTVLALVALAGLIVFLAGRTDKGRS